MAESKLSETWQAIETTSTWLCLIKARRNYPTNTLSAFTTRLAQPIDQGSKDKWEVGVCDVTCHPGKIGTFTAIDVVSANNALIYCD